MTDLPILFSAPMVQSLVRQADYSDGKTNSRRIIKPQPEMLPGVNPSFSQLEAHEEAPGVWRVYGSEPASKRFKVRFAKGDRLWVRETWQTGVGVDGPQITFRATPDYFSIDAWDGPDEGRGPSFNYDRCPGATWHTNLSDLLNGAEGDWRPGIHMPRWASRLTLAVTDVRVHRLFGITEGDCVAEGPPSVTYRRGPGPVGGLMVPHPTIVGLSQTPRAWFRELWESINGPGSWDANPWVVALTFTVERRNIDAETNPNAVRRAP